MALPFKVGPEPTKRSGDGDAFLEFEPERSGQQPYGALRDLLGRQAPAPEKHGGPSGPPPEEPRRSALSPAFAFAVGVAGLVTASVAYYQMGQFLSARATAPAPASSGAARSGAAGAQAADPTDRPAARPAAGRSATAPAPERSPAVVPPPAPVATGWVTFDTALPLRIIDHGRARGTTGGRLTLAAGTYQFELVNEAFELRQPITLTVGAGRTTAVTVPVPSGSLSVNALPWADVWIDGNPVGTTPLANLALPVGSHDVIWRHPTLGERRQTVAVKATTPARIGVDFNR